MFVASPKSCHREAADNPVSSPETHPYKVVFHSTAFCRSIDEVIDQKCKCCCIVQKENQKKSFSPNYAATYLFGKNNRLVWNPKKRLNILVFVTLRKNYSHYSDQNCYYGRSVFINWPNIFLYCCWDLYGIFSCDKTCLRIQVEKEEKMVSFHSFIWIIYDTAAQCFCDCSSGWSQRKKCSNTSKVFPVNILQVFKRTEAGNQKSSRFREGRSCHNYNPRLRTA